MAAPKSQYPEILGPLCQLCYTLYCETNKEILKLYPKAWFLFDTVSRICNKSEGVKSRILFLFNLFVSLKFDSTKLTEECCILCHQFNLQFIGLIVRLFLQFIIHFLRFLCFHVNYSVIVNRILDCYVLMKLFIR